MRINDDRTSSIVDPLPSCDAFQHLLLTVATGSPERLD